jgi:hypothetical protein
MTSFERSRKADTRSKPPMLGELLLIGELMAQTREREGTEREAKIS